MTKVYAMQASINEAWLHNELNPAPTRAGILCIGRLTARTKTGAALLADLMDAESVRSVQKCEQVHSRSYTRPACVKASAALQV